MIKKILAVMGCLILLLSALVVWDMGPVWAEEFHKDVRTFDCVAALLAILAFIPSVFVIDDEAADDNKEDRHA